MAFQMHHKNEFSKLTELSDPRDAEISKSCASKAHARLSREVCFFDLAMLVPPCWHRGDARRNSQVPIRLPPNIAYLGLRSVEFSRMASPSIIPNGRLDKDFYVVLEEFRDGAAFRETDEGIDHATLVDDLLTGQHDRVLRVVAFNPAEGWSRDASDDIALEHRIAADSLDTSPALKDFVKSQLGRDRRSAGASAPVLNH